MPFYTVRAKVCHIVTAIYEIEAEDEDAAESMVMWDSPDSVDEISDYSEVQSIIDTVQREE